MNNNRRALLSDIEQRLSDIEHELEAIENEEDAFGELPEGAISPQESRESAFALARIQHAIRLISSATSAVHTAGE